MNDKLRAAILDVLIEWIGAVADEKFADAIAERISRDFCMTERGDEKANETMERLLADKQRLEGFEKMYKAVLGQNEQLQRELTEARREIDSVRELVKHCYEMAMGKDTYSFTEDEMKLLRSILGNGEIR